MKRRDFLKFIPLIPIALKFYNPSEGQAAITPLATLQERIRIIDANVEQRLIPSPANGSYWTKEEIEAITPLLREAIQEYLERIYLKERLNETIRQTLMNGLGK